MFSGPPSGMCDTRRRSSTWPSAQVSVSPGSRRWMPSKIVSVPVVNCNCSSSSRAAGRTDARHQARLQQRLRFRGERQPAGDLGDIQRLDAERVARQRHRALHALMDGDRVHAAQMLRVVGALAQPQMQRRLAVAVGGEADRRHRRAQFAVIVDLAVADQRGGTGEQRLIAGHQIDDRQPVVHQRDAAHHRVAGAIRAAVTQAVDQFRQRGRFGRRRAARQDQSGNAAHRT